jgi:predicted ATPase
MCPASVSRIRAGVPDGAYNAASQSRSTLYEVESVVVDALSEKRLDTRSGGAVDPPTEFVKLVGEALGRLYDLPYLQTHPLVDLLGLTLHSADAGRLLQGTLIDAVKGLGRSDRELAQRKHRILMLRYLEGVEVPAVLRKLAISRSQYYREHQKAVRAVALMVWHRHLHQSHRIAVAANSAERAASRASNLGSQEEGLAAARELPTALTSFVGRERDIAEVDRLLEVSRLVTLTGPPGVGKTRLAVEVAARVEERFPDGVYFVPVAAIRDPDLVASAVAQVLGVREVEECSLDECLRRALRNRDVLLVLDNVEQVADAGSWIVYLLRSCEQLVVLATSRVRLQVTGEFEFSVPPLEVTPPTQGNPMGHDSGRHLPAPSDRRALAPAVALFLQRAQAVDRGSTFRAEDLPTVAQICARLDGLPLAIELAAARSKLLAPQSLAARLDNRLSLLTGGPHDLPVRHQTLRAAIAWSYDLLSEPQRILFEKLSVFAGGWTLEAGEAVATGEWPRSREEGKTAHEAGSQSSISFLDLLGALVDSSLVRSGPLIDGVRRFTMLETIREFARERLEARGEAHEVRERHARYFVSFAEQTAELWQTPQVVLALDRVAVEIDNLRSAMDWLASRDPDMSLRLTGALGRFWYLRGSSAEGCERLAAALATGGPTNDRSARARALGALGELHQQLGKLDASWHLISEALSLHREIYDLPAAARCYWALGRVALRRRETATRAAALYEDGLAIARAVEDRQLIGVILTSLGIAMRISGKLARAQAYWEQARSEFLGFGLRGRGLASCLAGLAALALDRREIAAARLLVDESLEIGEEQGDALVMGRALEVHAGLVATMGGLHAAENALQVAGAAAVLRESRGVPSTWYEKDDLQRWLTGARALLPPEDAAAAWDTGQRLSFEEVLAGVRMSGA